MTRTIGAKTFLGAAAVAAVLVSLTACGNDTSVSAKAGPTQASSSATATTKPAPASITEGTAAAKSLTAVAASVGAQWQKASGSITRPDALVADAAKNPNVTVERFGILDPANPASDGDTWTATSYGILCIANTRSGLTVAWSGKSGHTAAATTDVTGLRTQMARNTAIDEMCLGLEKTADQ